MEWNPYESTTGSGAQRSKEELVTAAQDCLVKFHDMSDSLLNTSTRDQTYEIMPKIDTNACSFRTVVPVWKARYVNTQKFF